MTRPLTRFVLHLVCPACGRGYYAARPVALPQACPTCAGERLRPVGMWALVTEARPAWRVLSHAEVQP